MYIFGLFAIFNLIDISININIVQIYKISLAFNNIIIIFLLKIQGKYHPNMILERLEDSLTETVCLPSALCEVRAPSAHRLHTESAATLNALCRAAALFFEG